MGNARVAMHSIEEVPRLHRRCGCSRREICSFICSCVRACGLSAGAVNKLLIRSSQESVHLRRRRRNASAIPSKQIDE